MIFWSTIAFAFGGIESGSTMGEEIHDARRTVPRAVLAAGVVITALYVLGTLGVLIAIPKTAVSGLQGIMQAVQAMVGAWALGVARAGCGALVTVNAIGGVGGWFAATARLPFVAGIDRFLPPAFGRLHPTLAHALCGAAGAGRHRRAVRLPRASGHLGARRLRRARQHGDHRVFHPVPLHVRSDDQAAE